jgi:tRNA(Ile)-lysidine synthase
MPTVAEVRERVRVGGLLPAGSRVVAMVSGGRDSVCLLDVAVALLGAESVWVLHVNYGLRGADSDGDERHCRELCERLGVQLEVVGANREEGATGNLHAWARDLRYAAATELAERHEALIATGHTATDQVETILYRLAASPGRRALLGMPASEGRLVRPLLGVTREATASYCLERKLTWREDESNDDPQYARARVRHGLLRALEAVHPGARANVLRTAELLREETDLLELLVESELGGAKSISIGRLEQLHVVLQRLVVIRLAEDAAGTYVPQAGERVVEILDLGARGGRAEFHVGGLASAVIEDGTLRMVRIIPRAQRPPSG